MKPIDTNTDENGQYGKPLNVPLSDKASEQISDEATQWLLTIEEDNSATNQQALAAWLSLSTQHKKTYQQLQIMWQLADHFPEEVFSEDLALLPRIINPSEKLACNTVFTKTRPVGQESTENTSTPVTSTSTLRATVYKGFLAPLISLFTLRKTMYMASFASVVFATFLTVTQFNQEVITPSKPVTLASANTLRANEYQTQRGEHKTITAKDGSIIVIAAKSQIFIDYSTKQRDIYLLYGEALFTVEKDNTRPFVVHNRGHSVQAIGTIFNVRDSKTELDIAVLEGVVEVKAEQKIQGKRHAIADTASSNMAKVDNVIRLVAGQALQLDDGSHVATTYPIDIGERMAWQDGRLNYVNTDLANVIFDLKRYSTLSIHIPDKQVANMGYTGSVIYDKVDDWLIALPYIFPVEVQRHGDSVVIVKK